MRPGLVAVGVLLLVLGGGILAATLTVPAGSGTGSAHRLTVHLGPGSVVRTWGWGVNGTGTVFALAWSSSSSLFVSIAEAAGCSGDPKQCQPGPTLAAWGSNTSGAWSTDQSVQYPLLLTVRNPGETNVTLSLLLTSSTASVPSLSMTSLVLDLIGGVTLAAIGALAAFLGLFLRSGVFGPRREAPPPPNRPGY